jgi:hypothetical protein
MKQIAVMTMSIAMQIKRWTLNSVISDKVFHTLAMLDRTRTRIASRKPKSPPTTVAVLSSASLFPLIAGFA